MKRNEDNIEDLRDSIKQSHIHITGVQEGEERKRAGENT